VKLGVILNTSVDGPCSRAPVLTTRQHWPTRWPVFTVVWTSVRDHGTIDSDVEKAHSRVLSTTIKDGYSLCFTNPTLRSLTSSFRTAFTLLLPGPFLIYSVLVFNFSLFFFISVPCARLGSTFLDRTLIYRTVS